MRLAEIIHMWRLANDLNQAQVAKQIGISVATYSRFERGLFVHGRVLARILVWALSYDRK